MRSIYDNVAVGGLTGPLSVTQTAVFTLGAVVDTKGYNSACLRVFTTPVGTGILVGRSCSVVAIIQESADNVTFTTATDVSATNIGGTTTVTTSAVISSYRIEGLNQNRLRYLRVKLTPNVAPVPNTNSESFTMTAVIELARGYARPVTTTVSNT